MNQDQELIKKLRYDLSLSRQFGNDTFLWMMKFRERAIHLEDALKTSIEEGVSCLAMSFAGSGRFEEAASYARKAAHYAFLVHPELRDPLPSNEATQEAL